jgi:DNA-dependent RNA polymerase auxiliary subunit epsilon
MDNTKAQKEVLEKLRTECIGTGVFKTASIEYGCSLSYISRVLSGKANYNAELISTLASLLLAYKKEQARHIAHVKKSLGF